MESTVQAIRQRRLDAATRLLAGLLANPNIVVHNANCGWSLCNVSEVQLAGYAVRLANDLIEANDEIPMSTGEPAGVEVTP